MANHEHELQALLYPRRPMQNPEERYLDYYQNVKYDGQHLFHHEIRHTVERNKASCVKSTGNYV